MPTQTETITPGTIVLDTFTGDRVVVIEDWGTSVLISSLASLKPDASLIERAQRRVPRSDIKLIPAPDATGAYQAAIAAASEWLYDRGYEGISDDECACLADPARAAEALDMIDHWQARCDLPDHYAAPLIAGIKPQF